MITTCIILIGLIISAVLFFGKKDKWFETIPGKEGDRFGNGHRDEKKVFRPTVLIVPLIMVMTTFIFAAIQPFRLERINAGCVGIEVKLSGSERGVTDYKYKTGWVIYNKWVKQIIEIPTTIQHIEYKEQPVTTKGGFPTVINPTFNYSVKPETAGDMYVNLRSSLAVLEQGWIKTAIVGAANDVANTWTIDSVFNNLGVFELSIKAECNKRLDRWFSIDQLRINITPPDALKESIAQKTKAIQDVQVAENNRKVMIAQGESRIAKARADSTVSMIGALTEAAVIKTKQQQLTPMYIDWLKTTKWDGALPTTILGNSNGVMLNLGN